MQDLDKLSVDSSVEEIRAMIYGVRKEAGLPEPEASQLDIVQDAMTNRKPLDASMFETGHDYKRLSHLLFLWSAVIEALGIAIFAAVGICIATKHASGAGIVASIGAIFVCWAAHKALRFAGRLCLGKSLRKSINEMAK